MLNITVEYFAQFRDLAGKRQERLQLPATTPPLPTIAQVYDQLAAQYHFPLGKSDVKVAINEEFAHWDYQLKDGDTLVFIPPVAGG